MSKLGNIFTSAHVKKNTAGTSNELSFSVLGAAKQEMDKRHGEARRSTQPGEISLFTPEKKSNYRVETLSDAKSEERRAASDQVKEKKPSSDGDFESKEKGRQGLSPRGASSPSIGLANLFSSAANTGKKALSTSKRGVTFVAAAVVVAFVVAFSAIGLSGYSAQRAAYTNLVVEVLEVIEQSDGPIVHMNDVLASPSSEESLASFGEVSTELDAAEEVLVRAEEMLAVVENRASTPSERETAARLAKDIAGRRGMIENGRMILFYVEVAQRAMGCLEEAWSLVGQSNEALSDAAELLSMSMDSDGAYGRVSTSIACLEGALEKTAQASMLFPSADLSPFQGFLDKEMLAVQKELEAIQALKNLDGALAMEAHAEYEDFDNQAQQSLAGVTDVDSLVINAYQAITDEFITGYEASRTEVALSDGYLRDFSGRKAK